MNNGIFGLDSPQTYSNPNINGLLGTPSIISSIYGTNLNKNPQINYDNLVFVIDTTKEASNIVTLPLIGTVNCTVDWGDGSTDRYTAAANRTHTYASKGEYTIQVIGTVTSLLFSNTSSNKAKIIRCLSFGNLPLTSLNFTDCTNLVQVPNNLPTGVTSLLDCFRGCFSFNQSLDSWDTSRITNMFQTFYFATSFNRDLNSWNTSNVTNFAGTFNNASKFNGAIGNWDMRKATTIGYMFYASLFNQSITSWSVGSDSSVTTIDMTQTFRSTPFNQDISNWNTSKVTSMAGTFQDATSFNQPIGSWNVSNVSSFNAMLQGTSAFNRDLSSWNVNKGTDFGNMFAYSAMNSSVSGWQLGSDPSVPTGVLLNYMFYFSSFNHPSINTWNTNKVTSLDSTFRQCIFNQPISGLDTSNVTNMTATFLGNASFNQSINNWNVGKVTSFTNTFQNAVYNQPLSGWNIGQNVAVSSTISMGAMFNVSSFNQAIENWNVSKVNSFSSMFTSASYNQSLSGWSATLGSGAGVSFIDMSYMFNGAPSFNASVAGWSFNKPTICNDMFYNTSLFNHSSITGWQTSGITTMANMFYNNRVFNQPIGSWNVRNVTNMSNMFNFCTAFNQNLSGWNIAGLNNSSALFGFWQSITVSTANYDPLLIDWNNNKASFRSSMSATFGSSKYSAAPSAAATARSGLVAYGWTITDGGSVVTAPDPPTSVSGTAGDTTVSLSWLAPTYNNGASITDYTIQYSSNSGSSWTTFNDGVSIAVTGNVTGLTNNTSYIFRVAAINSSATGNYSSNSASVTPVAAVSFSPTAVLLTSGTSYTVPAGATSMKVWAVGAGQGSNGNMQNVGRAGGTAYKTWAVTGGNTVTYTIGSSGGNTTITFSGTTITGQGGNNGGSFSGGDGGANGGAGVLNPVDLHAYGGAVGGNGTQTSCKRYPATDVSGLLSAVSLAGGTISETCATTAAFGSGGVQGKYIASKTPGLGGGGATGNVGVMAGGGGAVVLYFT